MPHHAITIAEDDPSFSCVSSDNFSKLTKSPALLSLFSYALANFSLIVSPILSAMLLPHQFKG